MAHKDLSDDWREAIYDIAADLVFAFTEAGQSTALGREAFIEAYDIAAAATDALDARAEADREYYDKRVAEMEATDAGSEPLAR